MKTHRLLVALLAGLGARGGLAVAVGVGGRGEQPLAVATLQLFIWNSITDFLD